MAANQERTSVSPDHCGTLYPLLVLAALVVLQLIVIARYASRLPSWDDVDRAEVSLDIKPLTPGWLWYPRNEHRIPLPLLTGVALDRAFHFDQAR